MTDQAIDALTGTEQAAAPDQTAEAADWISSFQNPDLASYVKAKGFEGPEAVVNSYRELEKLKGVPDDRLLKLPEPGGDMGPIYDRLGRPKDPSGYELPVPEGDDGSFAKTASEWMYEAGISDTQAKAIAEKWNEHNAAYIEEANRTAQETSLAQKGELEREWGAALEKNEQVARAGARALGMDAETINALEQAMGYKNLMNLMKSVGDKMGEQEFIKGGSNVSSDSALARIESLKADKAFVEKYLAGDVDARAEMGRLSQIAYPGVTQLTG